jgi:site-specific recombinase XerD
MTTSSTLLAPHVHAFFTDHLCRHKRVSPQTLVSCRDSFRLLLTFIRQTSGIEPSALCVTDLDAPTLLAFLDYLEQQRGNSIRSRNIRLSALRTFFRFVALRDPESVEVVTRVLAIPIKREDKKLVGSLTRPEIDALMAAPDRSSWIGRRDHALLFTMYNSGARVSEITSLKRQQVSFGATTFLELHGKGRKERTIPLWPQTRDVLKRWFRELGEHKSEMAFPNARGRPLARHSVNYLIHKAVEVAAPGCPSLLTRPITPHLIRHTTATHLLQAGIDIATIALWLGHESIETTHVYLEADLATKEQALQKLAPVEDQEARFIADDPLLAFLTSL